MHTHYFTLCDAHFGKEKSFSSFLLSRIFIHKKKLAAFSPLHSLREKFCFFFVEIYFSCVETKPVAYEDYEHECSTYTHAWIAIQHTQ